MSASFFQSLRAHRVEYLLISGQAAVLYGASTFSEDIDIWVNPTDPNRQTFIEALRGTRAQYYKLTPPFELRYLAGGHGFHFLLPDEAGDEIFLDVLGVPPRVPDFGRAQAEAAHLETDWGEIPVIDIKSLVELKKTQRLEDYPVISNLVIERFRQDNRPWPEEEYRWALNHLFTLSGLSTFFEEQPAALAIVPDETTSLPLEFGRQFVSVGPVESGLEDQLARWMSERMNHLQRADRKYWRAIIAELKTLRAAGELMREGDGV